MTFAISDVVSSRKGQSVFVQVVDPGMDQLSTLRVSVWVSQTSDDPDVLHVRTEEGLKRYLGLPGEFEHIFDLIKNEKVNGTEESIALTLAGIYKWVESLESK